MSNRRKKILVDECLPRKLAQQFLNHDATTVPKAGLAGLSNGKLLATIADRFDVFLTIDGNLQWQQNLDKCHLTVIVIKSYSNRLEDLLPLVPQIISAIENGLEIVITIS